jgi:ketosteroid isomerase-like protein
MEVTMQVDRNVETVKRLFRAVEERDVEPMYEIYDREVEIDEAPSLPYGGRYHGHDGMVEHGLRYMAAWDHLQTDEDRDMEPEFVGAGDRVLVRWRQKAHAAQGSLNHSVVSEYLLRDGKVVETRMHTFDSAAVARVLAKAVLQRLHQAQQSFYGGGALGPLRAMLADDITWTVPGRNAIAGIYSGAREVIEYFERRRDLAQRSLRLHPVELLVGEGQTVASLTDGTATIGGTEHRWSTVGLYRLRGERVAACWLLPLDQELFDRVWAGPPSARSTAG